MQACIRWCVLVGCLVFASSAPAQEPVEQGRTLSQWVKLLGDESPGVRQDACLALANMRLDAVPAVPSLCKVLTGDQDAVTRTCAAMALGAIGEKARAAVPDLAKALAKDADAGVRTYAAMALGMMGPASAEALAALDAAAKDGDASVRLQAEMAAKHIRKVAQETKPEGGNRPGHVRGEDPAGERRTGDDPGDRLPKGIRIEDTGPADRAGSEPGGDVQGPLETPPRKRSGDDDKPPAPPPTWQGKTLAQWIAQLDSKELGERLEAADALGGFGADAQLAVGPLNRLRLHDPHESVRRRAALALCRILGVALGDLQPRPKGQPGGLGGPGPGPTGRILFLDGVHDASEQGLITNEDIVDNGTGHRRGLFGYANLFVLDLAEAHKYRQDARARGLDMNKRLSELIDSDPKLADSLSILSIDHGTGVRAKIFHAYRGHYIKRIECNQQVQYDYELTSGSWPVLHGGCDFYGMTAGRYTAKVTIWTEEGFRLDFDVPFTVTLDLAAGKGKGIYKPADVAKAKRRQLTALVPGDPDTELTRRSLIGDIAREVEKYLIRAGEAEPLMPSDVLAFVRDTFELRKELHRCYPKGYTHLDSFLARLVSDCADIGTADALALAQEIVSYLEAYIANPRTEEWQRSDGYFHREFAYRSLAELTMTTAMDINAHLALTRQGHRYDDRITLGGKKQEMPPFAEVLKECPRPGWWNRSADEYRPPSFAEIVASANGGGGDGDGGADVTTGKGKQTVDEAVSKHDKQVAEDGRWLQEIQKKLKQANVNVAAALVRLDEIRREIKVVEARLRKKESYLSTTSGRAADLSEFGEQLFIAMKGSEQMRDDLAGAGGTERMKAVLEGVADGVRDRLVKLERERDQLVEDTLLDFGSVAQSLEKRGPECAMPDVQKFAKGMLEGLEPVQKEIKAQLYLASGQAKEFREAARDCLAVGEQMDYRIRLMESAHFQGQGKLSLALKSARLALKAKGEQVAGTRWELPDGTVIRELTSAQNQMKVLELKVLDAITAKITKDSDYARKLCEKQIGVHGEKGVTGFLYDAATMGRYVSAKGENSFIVSFYDWVTGSELKLPKRPLSLGATPIEDEATQAGKPESQSRELGVILDDKSRTCLGLAVIRRLRAEDVPLSQISSMSGQEFRQTVARVFGWQDMTEKQVMKMRSELHFALQQADVNKIVEGRSQVLDLEAGRSYYDTGSFTANWRDCVEDQFSALNVLMMALPNAKIAKAGRQVGFLKWANPSAAVEAVSMKQAFMETIGIAGAMERAANNELGRRVLTDLVDTHTRMPWYDKIAVDGILQFGAVKMAQYGTEYAAGMLGADEKAQEKAGRVAEYLAQIATGFAMDLDVAVDLASNALSQRQARIISEGLHSALGAADEMAALADTHEGTLRRALTELEGDGVLGARTQKLVTDAAEQLGEEIEGLRKALPERTCSHPLVNEHYDRLRELYRGLRVASEGMPAQAKAFSEFAEELSLELAKSRASLARQSKAFSQVAGGLGGTRHNVASGRSPFDDDLDFQRPSPIPAADQLCRNGHYKEAAKLYEAAHLVFGEAGKLDDAAAGLLAKRWRVARQLGEAKDYITQLRSNADLNADIMRPITDVELQSIKNASDLQLVPTDQGSSGPLWVIVGGKKVGIFKPPDARFAFGAQAEMVVPKLAQGLDIPSAASARTTMPVSRELDGHFVRYFEGDELGGISGRSTMDDLTNIKGASDLEFTPMGKDAPGTYWVTTNGKRAGIFAPGMHHALDPDATLGKIARQFGGESLDAVPTRMTMKEADGVFIRYIEGQDLFNLTDAERMVLKKEIARDWVLRLLVGDYDGHALNFKLASNGAVIPYDRNLADILDAREGTLQRFLNKSSLSSDAATMAQEVDVLMRARLKILTHGFPGAGWEHYQVMQHVAGQVVFEDFIETLEKLKTWDRAFLEDALGNAFGAQTNRAIEVIQTRVRLIRGVLTDTFPSVPVPVRRTSAVDRIPSWRMARPSPGLRRAA